MNDLDLRIVVDILRVGLPGLVFLLSLLAYRLLARLEDSEKPDANVLQLVKSYMYVNVALAVLTLASPIIEYLLSEKPDVFNIEALIATSDQEAGKAFVCQNSNYANRYLLIRDQKTQGLIQVFAGGIIPCPNNKHIVLSPVDVPKLGWQLNDTSAIVEVVTALPGYKFATSL